MTNRSFKGAISIQGEGEAIVVCVQPFLQASMLSFGGMSYLVNLDRDSVREKSEIERWVSSEPIGKFLPVLH